MTDHNLTAGFVLDIKHLTTINPGLVRRIVSFAKAEGEALLGSPAEEWWEPTDPSPGDGPGGCGGGGTGRAAARPAGSGGFCDWYEFS